MTAALAMIGGDELDEYPLGRDIRLDSHSWIPWNRRRWLNSDMRMKGRPECRAHYRDLIEISFDHTPIGTLPPDMEVLAKFVHVPEGEFRALCQLDYGPLHNWRPCLSEGERRLWHPMVLETVQEALARREDNRAKNEAANERKRRQRLRIAVTGYSAELGVNDSAVRWMDEWLLKQEVTQRTAAWIERAMTAWSNHLLDKGLRR